MKTLIFGLVFMIGAFNIKAQELKPIGFEQLNGFQDKEKKLVIVFIETDWCKYCKAMKQTILNYKPVSDRLKNNFYTVVLNAEEKRNIDFAGKVFKFMPSGVNTGFHQLAEQLGNINGQISYPALCILNDLNEIIYQYQGYLDSKSIIKMLDIISKANP